MLERKLHLLGAGNDYQVFSDPETPQEHVIKIPKKKRGHPTRFQAQYDDIALRQNFPLGITEHAFHSAGDGVQDFFWRQKKTQERRPLTLAALLEYRKQFLEILDCNDHMMESSGTSLDFFGYKCLHRQTWFPEKNTVLSDNLAICSNRGLVVEDLGLLHFQKNPMTQIPHKHIISYAVHRKIEQTLLLQLKKRI